MERATGPSQGDIKQRQTHRGPGDQLGCQGRDDCQEIGLKVKLASSSLSVCDLRAHHHLSMDSYFPTMSTPCKGFLDLPVCIQRAAAKIVVLAGGLDHIIPPRAPPWHPLFSAPAADGSSSLSQPFIIHLSSTHQLPCNGGPLHPSSPTSPFMLSPALLHTWEKEPLSICKATAPPSLKLSFVATSAETVTAELLCSAHRRLGGGSLLPPAAWSACTQPWVLHPCLDCTELRPSSQAPWLHSTQQNTLLTPWREPKTELSHLWASDSGGGVCCVCRC